MINLEKPNYKKIKELYDKDKIEKSAQNIRKFFSSKNENFSVFDTISSLDTMVILFDDRDEPATRYISFAKDETKNYLVLSANETIEEMRFNAACMLSRVARKIEKSTKTLSPMITTKSKGFSREDKHFACALLMPKVELLEFITRKDSNGDYLYLNENNEISFKNINAVADHFGVPFDQCASRIFHVFEDMMKTGRQPVYYIEGCRVKDDYKRMREKYSPEDRERDMLEVVPHHQQNRAKLISHLIDSLHYRSWGRLSEIAKQRLLVNLVKSDSVNEGVVKNEEEAKAIINNYLASNGTIYDGKLVTKDGECSLGDEQLVVLGELELYTKTLERGLIKGIAKSNPRLEYLTKLEYKEAINCIKERDLTTYICDLHRRLFSNLTHKYGEERGGLYRSAPVSLSGTNVRTIDPYFIPQEMDNISWRILEILKKNANGELSNSEYIAQVNECIYDLIRMQPFADGNKRTSRLLSNILYQEKGIPYVLVPVKEWDNYVNAWSHDDVSQYNEMMHRLILESYNYFYGGQSVNDITHSRVSSEKIIMANRK